MKTRNRDSPLGPALGFGPGRQELRSRSPSPSGGRGATAEGRRTEDGRRGRGTGPGYLRVRAQAVRSRHGCAPPPAVRGTQLLRSSDSRPAAAGDAQPPSGFPGVRGAGTHEEEVCSSANPRAGRKGGRPLSAGAGRGWRGRGPAEDAHVPSRCAAEGPPAARRSPHIRVPGDTQLLLRRPSPPRGTNTKLPAAATPLPSDGSYLRPSWVRLRGARLRGPEPLS
ncbi:uncharacterized protein LOC143434379 [Arvicanthis niloticus]|uniref:uncharacterized protein LOC143308732 n=1 Tax=Arvicanthis niloticus TaxID=61156 RepID=UPI00402B5D26